MSNPPAPPPATSAGQPAGSRNLNDVAEGQRWIIYAILIYVAAIVLRLWLGDIGIVLVLGAVGLGIAGILKLSSGFGYSTPMKVLLIILMFIPLISIVTLAILSARANEALKAGGYKVGLLGARQ